MDKIQLNLPLLYCQKIRDKIVLDLVETPVEMADLSSQVMRHAYAYAVDTVRIENGYAYENDIWVNAFGLRNCFKGQDNFAIEREAYHQSDQLGVKRVDQLDIGFNREIALSSQVAFERAKSFGVTLTRNALPHRYKRKLGLGDVVSADISRYRSWVEENLAHYRGRLMIRRPAPAIHYCQPFSVAGLHRFPHLVSQEASASAGGMVGVMTSVGLGDDDVLRPISHGLPWNLNQFINSSVPFSISKRQSFHKEGRLLINLDTYRSLDLEDDFLRRSLLASAEGLLAMYPKSRTTKNGGRDVLYALDEVLASRHEINDELVLSRLVELMEQFPMTYDKGRLRWLEEEKGDVFRLLMNRLFERWYDRDISPPSPGKSPKLA